MNNTLGDPGTARTGCGHAGVDSSVVRPTRPGKLVPGRYSLNAMARTPPAHEAVIGSLLHRGNTDFGIRGLTLMRWLSADRGLAKGAAPGSGPRIRARSRRSRRGRQGGGVGVAPAQTRLPA